MPPALLNRGVFNDFEQVKEATRGWSLDWTQLDRGPLEASLAQVATPSALVSYCSFDRAFEQRGASPPGTRTFGLVEKGVPGTRWCGRPLGDDQATIFDRTGEFKAVSPPGFVVHTVALSEELVADTCETLEAPGLERLLAPGSGHVVSCDPGPIEALRRNLRRIQGVVAAASPPPGLVDELESEIPVRLLGALAQGRPAPPPPNFGFRQLAMRRALPFIEAHREHPITVPELCKATRLSRRTLEYAFREQLGVSPGAYLVALRLNGVRRALVPSDPPLRVADVANHWGFWHMGQFAADYRRQFGELPSETLRRRSGG
jgi:AraC family ethanolamine operon transcriptional activator